MAEINEDGNTLGRVCAIALIALAAYGTHRLNCATSMCPVMKTDSCCGSAAPKTAATPALTK